MGGDWSRRRFWRISSAGILFQGGAAATEASTVIAALVHGLTGSPLAVGAAAAIVRYGWLFPQIFVAYLAQRHERRMPFYMFGAFGRAICLALLAGLVWLGRGLPELVFVAGFFALWTAYAFISGIVAVPYNDIVGRSIPSSRRSRLLAIRFFGGGLLALAVAAVAHELLNRYSFHAGYAAVLFIGALGIMASALFFVSASEPPVTGLRPAAPKFMTFLAEGLAVVRQDRRFRFFLYVQWLAGAVSMSLPFYILQIAPNEPVGILLGAQTAGALLSMVVAGRISVVSRNLADPV